MVLQGIPNVIDHSKWKVKEGEVFFWYEKWFGEEPLSAAYDVVELPRLKVRECKLEEGWDMELLSKLVGLQKSEEIVELLVGQKKGDDLLIWLTKEDVRFSNRSAWECGRVRAPVIMWADWIWHPCMPKFISTTM